MSIVGIIDLGWMTGALAVDWCWPGRVYVLLTTLTELTIILLIGPLTWLAVAFVTVLMILWFVRLVILLKTARPWPRRGAPFMATKNRELPALGLVPVTVSRHGWLNRSLGRNLLVNRQFGLLAFAFSGYLFRTTNLSTIWRNAILPHSGFDLGPLAPGLIYLCDLLDSLMKPVIAPGVRPLNRPRWTLLWPARRMVRATFLTSQTSGCSVNG